MQRQWRSARRPSPAPFTPSPASNHPLSFTLPPPLSPAHQAAAFAPPPVGIRSPQHCGGTTGECVGVRHVVAPEQKSQPFNAANRMVAALHVRLASKFALNLLLQRRKSLKKRTHVRSITWPMQQVDPSICWFHWGSALGWCLGRCEV